MERGQYKEFEEGNNNLTGNFSNFEQIMNLKETENLVLVKFTKSLLYSIVV